MASPSKVIVLDLTALTNHAAIQAAIDAALALESASLVVSDVDFHDLNFRGNRASSIAIGMKPKASPSSAGVRTILASDTATLDDEVILGDSTGGAVVVTLPPAATAANRIFTIKNIEDTGGVSVDPDGTEEIDNGGAGVAVDLTNVNDSITVVSDGTAWWVI